MLLLLLLFSFLAYSKSLQVPFVKQRDQFCGPASLSSVLQFYGMAISQEAIGERVHHPKLKGALITDLENYAKSLGLRVETRKGDVKDLRLLIDRGIPPIILVETGRFGVSSPHYMVVVGYEEDAFLLHTGYEKLKKVEEKELDRAWVKMGRVMLVVYPP
ncbi:MAG: peptidase C39 family protein [Aquificaceae bacterium]|nr:peptidase C39 family protein [Aquificaceae bacterium]